MFAQRSRALVLLGVALALAGCSSRPPAPRVWIPPIVELSPLGKLGLLEFAEPGSQGLGAMATREFLAVLHRAQPGTPVLELGDAGRGQRSEPGPDALRALGARHGVDAIVVGSIDAQRVAPKLAFDALDQWASASAQLEGGLRVRIVDTRSGATLWSTTASGRQEIARVDLSGGAISGMGGAALEEAQQRLVRRLVNHATGDFWGHWD